MCEFAIRFFHKGVERSFCGYAANNPHDEFDAYGVAWSAIRAWFETQGICMPDCVHNVQYIGANQYNWDIIPTTDSDNNK